MKSWLPLTLLAASLDPGTHRLEERTADGVRRYTLVIPEQIADEGAPLLLSLHYAGQVTPWYGAALVEQLVEPGLRELSPVIVAPDCPGRGWTDPMSRGWVETLLAAVTERLPVHDRKRAIVGYSMGAIGSWHYASVLSEHFAAFVPIAGAARPEDATAAAHPAFVVHGSADELFALEQTESLARAHRDRFASTELHVGEGLTHYQVPRYVRLLQGAAPWLEARWAEAPGAEEAGADDDVPEDGAPETTKAPAAAEASSTEP